MLRAYTALSISLSDPEPETLSQLLEILSEQIAAERRLQGAPTKLDREVR